jgi:Uma2 family endonuclease
MIAAREQFPQLTPPEYLEWEQRQEFRHEYVNGEVYAMTGGSVNHGEIAMNIGILLGNHLADSGCRVLTSDVKVQIAESNDYVYPDVSVTCDERDRRATKFIAHPCLIVEVLSPSTETRDRWEKFNLYRRSDSLQDYVLVDTNQIEIALYSKNDRNKWEIIRYGVGDIVELKSINLSFSIDRIYKNISFDLDVDEQLTQ